MLAFIQSICQRATLFISILHDRAWLITPPKFTQSQPPTLWLPLRFGAFAGLRVGALALAFLADFFAARNAGFVLLIPCRCVP